MTQHDLTVNDVPLDDLALLPGNPRQGDIGAVSESIEVNGLYQPIIINRGKPTSRTYRHGDPHSPTLDHIVPQSHTPIPDHGAHNLRLAHALCNSLRGDQVEGQEVLAHGMAHL